MRICSLLPSATEIVASLDLADSLVAVSEECDWPPRVRDLPVVTASRVNTNQLSSLEKPSCPASARGVNAFGPPADPHLLCACLSWVAAMARPLRLGRGIQGRPWLSGERSSTTGTPTAGSTGLTRAPSPRTRSAAYRSMSPTVSPRPPSTDTRSTFVERGQKAP
jgi:hypothetical protein